MNSIDIPPIPRGNVHGRKGIPHNILDEFDPYQDFDLPPEQELDDDDEDLDIDPDDLIALDVHVRESWTSS